MFDQMAGAEQARQFNPTLLRPGTLVYLWPPGGQPHESAARPIMVRVEEANANSILGVNLRDGSQARYDVATDFAAPNRLRWTWEVYAPPRPAPVVDGIERIEGSALSIEERIALVCGSPGATLTVRLKNGDGLVRVTLSTIIMGRDDWEAEWAVFTGNRDSAGEIAHTVRCDEIAGFSRNLDG